MADPDRLIPLGLSRYESSAYLAMLGHDDSTAVEVSNRANVPRQRIYDVLAALRDKGLIETRHGRPVRFTARPPAVALPAWLEARQRAQALENERLSRMVQDLVVELEDGGDGAQSILARALRANEDSIGGF